MSEWFKKLIADKDGSPNEHIVAAIWGSVVLLLLALYLIMKDHAPTLTEYAVAHGGVWTSAAGAQKLSSGS
jgi:hypothetical protein